MIKNTLNDIEMSKTITDSGDGLSILICSDYKHNYNWMAFSAWYSVKKYLPDAKITLTVSRSDKFQQLLYGWVYKCVDIRYFLHKRLEGHLNKLHGVYNALKFGLVKQPLIVLDADMMAVRGLSEGLIEKLNNIDFATNISSGPIWFFNNQSLDKFENITDLSLFGDSVVGELGDEVTKDNLGTFVHYPKHCGNFTQEDWVKGKVLPPFQVAQALQTNDLTLNEKKVLDLWSQMSRLYDIMK